jgi:hypothetical protein
MFSSNLKEVINSTAIVISKTPAELVINPKLTEKMQNIFN